MSEFIVFSLLSYFPKNVSRGQLSHACECRLYGLNQASQILQLIRPSYHSNDLASQ